MQQDQHLVIIGNGIAGVTLAKQVRIHSHCRITLISSESSTHFSRTALMYVYMGHMRYKDIQPFEDWYWHENKLEMLHDRVEKIDIHAKQLHLLQGETIDYDVLVLATGSCPAFYDWPGQHLNGVQGLVTLQDLEQMELNTQRTKHAVVVGGGLIGIEMAEMLRSRRISVTMLVRDRLFWHSVLPEAEALLITKHIQSQGITLLLEDELEEIVGDAQGNVRAVKTKCGQQVACQFVGIATGVKPNVDFLRKTDLTIEKGILVNSFFETNIPDVYAIGDCAQFREPVSGGLAIEQLWYTARLHGEALGANLLGNRVPYDRGPWFNSAKFINIEYQVYGLVPNKKDDIHDFLYWQHEDGTKAIRLVYERKTELLIGINLLGVRYRHDLCHHWLEQKVSLHEVMKQLRAANFDPEFYKRYEPALWAQYLQKFPDRQGLPAKSESNWWKLRKKFGLATTDQTC